MSTTDSITGATGDEITVTCDSGYTGSASATCQADGSFTSVTCSPSEFYCLEGDGGTCYPASTSCFGATDCNMNDWNEGNGYSNTYESFQDFCKTWSANSGNFYGGAGSCPGTCSSCSYILLKFLGGFMDSCQANNYRLLASMDECKEAASQLGLPYSANSLSTMTGTWGHTPENCWYSDVWLPAEELGFNAPGNGSPAGNGQYQPICDVTQAYGVP